MGRERREQAGMRRKGQKGGDRNRQISQSETDFVEKKGKNQVIYAERCGGSDIERETVGRYGKGAESKGMDADGSGGDAGYINKRISKHRKREM